MSAYDVNESSLDLVFSRRDSGAEAISWAGRTGGLNRLTSFRLMRIIIVKLSDLVTGGTYHAFVALELRHPGQERAGACPKRVLRRGARAGEERARCRIIISITNERKGCCKYIRLFWRVRIRLSQSKVEGSGAPKHELGAANQNTERVSDDATKRGCPVLQPMPQTLFWRAIIGAVVALRAGMPFGQETVVFTTSPSGST